MSLKEEDFVMAARLSGASEWRNYEAYGSFLYELYNSKHNSFYSGYDSGRDFAEFLRSGIETTYHAGSIAAGGAKCQDSSSFSLASTSWSLVIITVLCFIS